MRLGDAFNKEEHNQTIIDCFLEMWRYSADLMFIMAVEEGEEFSLYDNNPASKEVMGLEKASDIHRLNLRVQFGNAMAEQVYATYRQVLKGAAPVSIEQVGVRGDGSRIYFDTLFVPIFDSLGQPIFVCGVSRDITKIKEAEAIALQANEKLLEYSAALEAINHELDRKVQDRTKELEKAKRLVEESLEAKSSFVARMSHEIRTPINAVIGLSNLCLKMPLAHEQKSYLNTILSSGQNLLSLVNDVLDFSKMEAGKMGLEVVPFSPKKIVQYAIDLNTVNAEEKKLAVTIDISPSLPAMLLGDPLRIQQVLVNLVTNAVKFTERGGICVRMYTDDIKGKHIVLRCDVIDTGIGIAKTYLDQLFQSFQQADESITRQFGGTGLGLTISRQLCELMGGDIWVHSELGQGSTFSFTLPLNISTSDSMSFNDDVLHNSFKKANDIPNLSQYNVLLAEDNAINQKVILGYLNDTFINIDLVNNGEEAVRQLENKKYDLVLMDIQMPVMDGLTAARRISESQSYGNMPVIAMTADVSDEAKKKSKQAGMVAHLDKPIKQFELYQVLKKHLNVPRQPIFSQPHDFFGSKYASSYSDILSKLSAIDTLVVQSAIDNLGGKTSLYLDLVKAFYIKYKSFSLGQCLENDLVGILHSLKSNSAYIGAFNLSSHCAEIEKHLLQGILTPERLNRLEVMLKSLVKTLHIVLTSYSLPTESSKEETEPSKNDLVILLQTILPLLKKSDFFVENHFSLLRKVVMDTGYALDIENLIYDVKNIEFEKASIKAAQLILELQGD
ncbi:response regulator [Marinomonas hwangdonensis]|uniref:histidine kinase n=1 Tax=Marinomonas hwangdonensis TaxID=1053647 RepID=A0A3M8QEB1_9GAMM|nr:ATP-binding protein [Marinomonas hwangdonensis]RNF53060.1 response regulator [Marinomonas hwangdonensis]